jgi:hypothetical protein
LGGSVVNDDLRAVAQRLYYKVRRSNDGKIRTIGIARPEIGKEVFVVYFPEDSPMIYPTNFEGHGVVASVSKSK